MNQQEVLRDLECAHRNIGMVKLRVLIQNLLNPNVQELEEKVADSLAALVRVQEQIRKSKRLEERRI